MAQRYRPDPSHRDLGYSPHDDDRGRYASGLQRDDYRRPPVPDDVDRAAAYAEWKGGADGDGGVDARGRSRGGAATGASGASSSHDYWRAVLRQQPGPRQASHRGHGPKGYSRSDERLHEAICDRLTDDPDIDAREIVVTVKDGVVTLEGTVDNRLSKHIVEDLVDDCSGVKGIRNLIDVNRRAGMPGSA